MLLINIHQLDIVFAQPIALTGLEYKVDDIWRIFRLQRQDVVVLCSAQNFRKRRQIDAECDVAVASEGREHLGFEHHRDEGNMGVVHGLKGETAVIAVEVAVLDKILDCVDNLVEMSAEVWAKHVEYCVPS